MSEHTDARAVPAQKKAAGSCSNSTDGQAPKEGTELSSTTMAQSTYVHESLRHLAAARGSFDIRNSILAAPALLPEGDALWIDQGEVRRMRADAGFTVVRIYDLRTGERMFEGGNAPEGWFLEQMGAWYDRLDWFARRFPNTYVVNGRYLFVSGGSWVGTGMPDADGAVEVTSWSSIDAEARAESARERAEWLAAHAKAVAAVQPSWADEALTWVDLLSADDDEGDHPAPDMVEFRQNVGGVAIEQACAIDDGVFSLMGEPTIRITAVRDDYGVFSGADAARVGVDMIAAAAVIGEYVTVSELRRTAVAAGVRTGVLLQMTEG